MSIPTYTILVQPRKTPWLEFDYNGKPRLACVMKDDENRGGLICKTPDGWRTFAPSKMENVRDVSILETA